MLPCHAWLGKTPNSEFESSTEGYAWLNAPMVEAEALDLPLDVVRAARWLGTRARPGQTSWRRCSAIRGHSGRTFYRVVLFRLRPATNGVALRPGGRRGKAGSGMARFSLSLAMEGIQCPKTKRHRAAKSYR